MVISGKVFGALIGSFISFPMGTVLGLIIGHLLDSGHFHGLGNFYTGRASSRQAELQQLFFDCTFSIMGFIAKADGRVSEKEIQFAEQAMLQMQLTGERRRQAIHQFNQGKSAHFDYQHVLGQLRSGCRFQPSLLRTFLDLQVRVASVNGAMSSATREALRSVFQGLGIHEAIFEQFYRRSQAGYSYQQYGRSNATADPRQHLNDAYAILEVSSSDSNDDVKKAYRRKMSKNHPDRLIAKGMPPEMVKLATQKTQEIQDAYETIKQARSMN